MTLELALLSLLEDGPSHGYRLRRRLDALLQDEGATETSHVYAALAALERRGDVVACTAPSRGARTRRTYAITAAGDDRLRTWRARPDPGRGLLRRPLLLKVAVLAELGESMPVRLIAAERTRRERELGLLRRDVVETTLVSAVRERTARNLEVELWLLDRLAEEARSPAEPTTRRPA